MTSIKKPDISPMMIVTSFHPSPMGGSEIQAFRLARDLKQRGLDPYIVTLGRPGDPAEEVIDGLQVYRIRSAFNPGSFPRKKKTNNAGVTIEYNKNDAANFALSEKKSVFSLFPYLIFYLNVLRLIRRKRLRVDLIYVPIMEWTAFIGTLLARTLGKKVFIKDSTMNGISNLLRYPFGKRIQKTVARNAYFVAMTRVIRENLLHQGVSENRIFSIPNGVIPPPECIKRKSIRNKFVFVGNLYQQPAKGIDILLKSWKIVTRKIQDAELFVIGDGNLKAYADYCDQLGISKHVNFLGKQTNFQNHLLEAMAFILPSRREGMSNSLLEAMALGLPCIATNISGSQDLIRHQVNGLLVPVEDETALAQAITYMYENPDHAEKMGLEARLTIQREFTMDIVSRKYFELFQRAI